MELKVSNIIVKTGLLILSLALTQDLKADLKVCKKSDRIYISDNCKGNYLNPESFLEIVNKNCAERQENLAKIEATGPAGSNGEKGDKGEAGDAGTGLFSELPNAVTITGYAGDKIENFVPTSLTDYYRSITAFPYKANRQVKAEDITLTILISENAENITVIPLGRIGFFLQWKVPKAGYSEVRASWLYKAGENE